ncbi:FkbM family methyltransferase [Aurantiacibacter sediminis]|uniref:FkbM family methyltransferase n=1 Tax=Aurantiacibacter sediminis TaxID=2793064 RepID=A0ABS0N489_9SPHN|nr:FkbM family methyltransferase [Aurantiacibacter sediminis]MBH5321809.1 FkbM family methyltransferase [Aurantiacibacter sediminis]
MLKHRIASLFANLGISIGMPSEQKAVRALIRRLRPVGSGHNLIRMGADGDGGYLVPDDLEGIAACFSPGVDDRATFEADCAKRGIVSHLADASVQAMPAELSGGTFLRKYLGVVEDETTATLANWVNDKAPGDDDLILQMDIEGAEVPVLLNAPHDQLRRFRIIVLEAHHLDRLLDREGFTVMSALFTRLLEQFAVVHAHPNNYGGVVKRGDITVPRVIEFTLLRRDRLRDGDPAGPFPHPLDKPNDRGRADLPLPEFWRG